MTDHRIGVELVADILVVLDRHGFAPGDLEHQGRAIHLIKDAVRTYEGTQDHPAGPASYQAPVPPPPEPSGRDPVILPASDRKTMLIALGIAADDMRDRAEMCTDCPDQSCPSCQSRLRDAQACDQLSDRIYHAPEATPAYQASPVRSARQPRPADDKEAGQ
jgi:hypothetical protein